MTLCTPADVQLRFGSALQPWEIAAVEAMIDDFTGELEEMLGRPLSVRSFTETRYLPDGSYDLSLRRTPVVSIASVSVGGNVVDPSSYAQTQGGLLMLASFPNDPLAPLASQQTVVTVTYSAGIADVDRLRPARSAVIARSIRILARARDDAWGVNDVKVETYQAKYDKETFTDDELSACSRLRRRVIV